MVPDILNIEDRCNMPEAADRRTKATPLSKTNHCLKKGTYFSIVGLFFKQKIKMLII